MIVSGIRTNEMPTVQEHIIIMEYAGASVHGCIMAPLLTARLSGDGSRKTVLRQRRTPVAIGANIVFSFGAVRPRLRRGGADGLGAATACGDRAAEPLERRALIVLVRHRRHPASLSSRPWTRPRTSRHAQHGGTDTRSVGFITHRTKRGNFRPQEPYNRKHRPASAS